MIKPDGVQRNVVGNIIGRFEAKGYQLKVCFFVLADCNLPKSLTPLSAVLMPCSKICSLFELRLIK